MHAPRSTAAVLLLLGLASTWLGCAGLVEGLRSHAPADGTESAARLAPGVYDVERTDLLLVDPSRPEPSHAGFAGASSRTLRVSVWSPVGAEGARPLILYSHGFSGNRTEMLFLLEHLASHGYAVAALDFPRTHGAAPGGPDFLDLHHQPGDVRFVLDTLLAKSARELGVAIDEDRIGLAGLSYGGLTTTLLAFHPTEREPRARAAVSIAGPTQMLGARFFAEEGPPFLMVAGTEDAIVPHDRNAAGLRGKLPAAALVSLEAGTHLGFVEFARVWLRFHRSPDSLACGGIREQLEEVSTGEDPGDAFGPLGGPEQGIDGDAWDPPCSSASDDALAMRPQRQQYLTALAVRAFFDSRFLPSASDREAAEAYLRTRMADELDDASYDGPG